MGLRLLNKNQFFTILSASFAAALATAACGSDDESDAGGRPGDSPAGASGAGEGGAGPSGSPSGGLSGAPGAAGTAGTAGASGAGGTGSEAQCTAAGKTWFEGTCVTAEEAAKLTCERQPGKAFVDGQCLDQFITSSLEDFKGTWQATTGDVVGPEGAASTATSVKIDVIYYSQYGYWDVEAEFVSSAGGPPYYYDFATELHPREGGAVAARCFDSVEQYLPVGTVNADGLALTKNLDINCDPVEGSLSLRPLPGGKLRVELTSFEGAKLKAEVTKLVP
jgi:hypothetical protein